MSKKRTAARRERAVAALLTAISTIISLIAASHFALHASVSVQAPAAPGPCAVPVVAPA